MIRVANAPCSWGVLEFDGACESAPFTEVLDEMQSAGYAGTELGDWGFMPTSPRPLAEALERRHLALLGAFVPVALSNANVHAAGIETAVRTAALMRDAGAANAVIVLSDANGTVPARERKAGRITPADSLTTRGWATFAEGASRVARAVRQATGLRMVFHPHCGGYVETPAEIDTLMAQTDPAEIGLVLDTGHIVYGGGDPLAVLQAHADRVWHVHFKDCDGEVAERARSEELGYLAAVRAQLFCELGRGIVDFGAVITALKGIGYHGWIVVEQDVFPGIGTPLESARRNREYLRRLGV
jgi:inosose dehydratase